MLGNFERFILFLYADIFLTITFSKRSFICARLCVLCNIPTSLAYAKTWSGVKLWSGNMEWSGFLEWFFESYLRSSFAILYLIFKSKKVSKRFCFADSLTPPQTMGATINNHCLSLLPLFVGVLCLVLVLLYTLVLQFSWWELYFNGSCDC